MKRTIKLLGIVIASIALVACGGGSDPVKTEKVWKLVEETRGITKTIFEYDGSGNVIKQNNLSTGGYVEFNYDNKGMLLTREEFSASREVTEHVEFDSHGEVILRSLSDSNGVLVTDITYINTYDERIVLDGAPKRNNAETSQNSYLIIYPASRLVSRKREGRYEWLEEYSYDENKVNTKMFSISSNGAVIREFYRIFNEQGDVIETALDVDGDGPELLVVGREYIYTYAFDMDGNISEKVTTEGDQSSTITYKWAQFDIPVQ